MPGEALGTGGLMQTKAGRDALLKVAIQTCSVILKRGDRLHKEVSGYIFKPGWLFRKGNLLITFSLYYTNNAFLRIKRPSLPGLMGSGL